jgi:UPF0755 protein
MRRLWSNLLTLAATVAILAAVGMLWARDVVRAKGPSSEPVVYIVERGSGLRSIASGLEKAGAISDATFFSAAARLLGVAGALKAGEYKIPANASVMDVLAIMSEGKVLQRKVTVVEGRTVKQIVALLNENNILTGTINNIPPEGSLAPETYFIAYGERRQTLLDRMVAVQNERLERLWAARAASLPLSTPQEALILASIVEKETGLKGERAVVSSVFVNRLRKGMRLQSDPTVVYGITLGDGPLGRGLRKSELKAATPYNTYVIDGLPPTPIANPGAAAIHATLNPDNTEYLYFVADGAGGHAFAKSYQEHQRNVTKWREVERQRKQSGG